MQGSDGNFYGTAANIGVSNVGNVYLITSSGVFTTLFNFAGFNGATPSAGVVQGSNGDLYGTTTFGGASGLGTVFRLTIRVDPPTNKDQCKNGGWQIFISPHPFKNQGDCIQFVNTGK